MCQIFKAHPDHILRVVHAKPDVFAHNIETVERLSPAVRDARASYRQSLYVLEKVKDFDDSRYTKSSIMLGLGETKNEIRQTLRDLRDVGCDVVTFGSIPTADKKTFRC